MAAITPNQRAALETLARRGPCSAYEARLQRRTLRALERKGLAQSSDGIDSLLSPTTGTLWRATDAGRSALNQPST